MYLIWSRPKRSNLKANKACDEYLHAFHLYVQRQGPIPSTCKKQCTMNNFKNKSNAKKENKFLI